MAAEAVATLSWWQRTSAFVRDSYHEIRYKTTWPDWPRVRQASIAIIIFVLIVGLMIALLDVALNAILIRLLPSLFS